MTEQTKAVAIEKRYKMQCDICMLLDTDAAKGVEFFVYDEGYFTDDADKYICSKCVAGLKELREKCHQKVANPKHKIFNSYIPWFAKEVPGMVESFKKQAEDLK